MTTFVLVHGSWHDGSAWRDVIRRLEARGHKAFGPTVSGHGKGVCKRVSHARSTQSIVNFIVGHDLTDVVLGRTHLWGNDHQQGRRGDPGSSSVTGVLERFVLNDGESINDTVPPHFRGLFRQLAAASPDNTVMLPFTIWREAFLNDADLTVARSSYELLSAEPYQQILEPLDLKKFYALDTPRSYLVRSEDIALPPGEWGWHPRMSSRLGLYRLVQMPGGHERIFTNKRLGR
jgi:hypothetical protein